MNERGAVLAGKKMLRNPTHVHVLRNWPHEEIKTTDLLRCSVCGALLTLDSIIDIVDRINQATK